MNVVVQDPETDLHPVSGPTIARAHAQEPRTDRAGGPGAPGIWLPLLALAGLGGFALVTWLVVQQSVLGLDRPLLDTARGLSPYMPAWQGLSDSANYPLIVIGVGLVLFLLVAKRRSEAVLVMIALAAVTAGSEAVKQLVARPRPPGFDNPVIGVVYSYPSGHVLEATVIYGIISVLLWRSSLPKVVRVAVPIASAVLVALVAVARVAAGAHYPSDVLAGLLGGIGAVALFAWVSGIIRRRQPASVGR
jgi:membrane-associated phospholipid phosphatase